MTITSSARADFPRKADFNIAEGYTYISGAYTHPLPIAAAERTGALVDRRGMIGTPRGAPPPAARPTRESTSRS
jgi:hypothetical protein